MLITMPAISPAQARVTRELAPPATCHNCSARTRCLVDAADGAMVERLERSVLRRLPLLRHEVLFRRDEPCFQLYAVRDGQFKSQRGAPGAASQVLGFYMPGELLGLEALDSGVYGCDAVALTDSVVCVLPYPSLTRLLAKEAHLQQQFHRLMGKQIERQQSIMLLLGSARAPQRLAAFLLDQAARSALRGESPTKLQLRMSREDIGAYLGLTVESVSRLLSRFRRDGVLRVNNRAIELLAPELLREIVNCTGL